MLACCIFVLDFEHIQQMESEREGKQEGKRVSERDREREKRMTEKRKQGKG